MAAPENRSENRSGGRPASRADRPRADRPRPDTPETARTAKAAETSGAVSGLRSGARKFLARQSLPERTFVTDALRTETVGGVILLVAAIAALIFANTPLSGGYHDLRDFTLGPEALHLRLTVGAWATDGLLTLFFFVAGIELKRELVAGELRDPRAAALPVIAAICGMAVPAVVYTVVNTAGGGSLKGWAVPTATDIAFALAVLAVLGTALPAALRAFLLTLAVVDDLFAILIIAIFYTTDIDFAALGLSAVGLAVFWLLHRRGVRGWYVYVPLALVIWSLMHASGVHATVAGVAMGLMLRCTVREGEQRSPAERIEHRVRPLSAGLAVPVFAVFAAGVSVSGDSVAEVFSRPETLGVVLGLVAGKTVGVFGGSWLAARFTRAELNEDLAWADVFAVASLAGIGFTVSLLIGELAFPGEPALADEVKTAVLLGSLIAAVLAGVLLKLRNNRYRRLCDEEERDEDHDGIPDVYELHNPEYHLRMAAIYEEKAAEHRRLAEAAGSRHSGEDGPA
ncbi:Na+/H+ antiporter NhaA [Streptomyces sp. B1866]|uniref:Na+/H+ antiporter NhaA n=1 Tax=Streptomyces sp. B1866 TaxID=3075431 RepID=UPI0028912250|nr:Na+/H+ antiporter NhaA [Streptomyces sp. B1866]MDT3395156.1 Na+/H+ antiporter NhaA [Streptomyces sp. B1866]